MRICFFAVFREGCVASDCYLVASGSLNLVVHNTEQQVVNGVNYAHTNMVGTYVTVIGIELMEFRVHLAFNYLLQMIDGSRTKLDQKQPIDVSVRCYAGMSLA